MNIQLSVTVSNSGLLFSHSQPSHSHPLILTFTFKLHLINQHAKYLPEGHKLFSSKVSLQTDTRTGPIALPGPLKWSVNVCGWLLAYWYTDHTHCIKCWRRFHLYTICSIIIHLIVVCLPCVVIVALLMYMFLVYIFSVVKLWLLLWLPNRAGHYILQLWFLLSFSSFFLAYALRLQIGCLPYFTHCANLECRSEMCCTRLAENIGHKNLPYAQHRTTLSGYIFTTKACIDNRKTNLLNSTISSTCPHNIVNLAH